MKIWIRQIALTIAILAPTDFAFAQLDPGRPAAGEIGEIVDLTSCRPIDFVEARLEYTDAGDWVVFVRGVKPEKLQVQLVPVLYVVKPDYWLHTLVGCPVTGDAADIGPTYEARIQISGSVGSRGVDISGKSRTVRLEKLKQRPADSGGSGRVPSSDKPKQ